MYVGIRTYLELIEDSAVQSTISTNQRACSLSSDLQVPGQSLTGQYVCESSMGPATQTHVIKLEAVQHR